MSRLDKRGRMEKREREKTEKRLAIIRKSEAERDRWITNLPTRERRLLTGESSGKKGCMDPMYLMGRTHYANAIVGTQGSNPVKRKPMPNRFLPGFMAMGHEALGIEKSTSEAMVKVGRAKNGEPKWRIVGKADTKPLAGK